MDKNQAYAFVALFLAAAVIGVAASVGVSLYNHDRYASVTACFQANLGDKCLKLE